MASKQITEEMKAAIIAEYKSKPQSLKTLGEKFDLCIPTIMKILNGIELYKKAQIFNPNLNERFFENIDSEAKAYFLGLIIADGNVFIDKNNQKTKRQASISITLDKNDKYLLESFKQCVGANTSIGNDGRGCHYTAVRSDLMAQDLSKYGIVPRKSYITYLPKIDNKWMPHLIRGIFDGDGSATFKQTPRRFLHGLAFCGSVQLMNDISDYIFNFLQLDIKPKVYSYQDKELSEIKVQNIQDIYKLGNWMYENATIFMKRKKDKFDLFIAHYNL